MLILIVSGAEKVGEIVADFTHLRDMGIITPIPAELDDNGKRQGKKRYEITFIMVIRVRGRDLQCKFRERSCLPGNTSLRRHLTKLL